jgi:hypothetical protein
MRSGPYKYIKKRSNPCKTRSGPVKRDRVPVSICSGDGHGGLWVEEVDGDDLEELLEARGGPWRRKASHGGAGRARGSATRARGGAGHGGDERGQGGEPVAAMAHGGFGSVAARSSVACEAFSPDPIPRRDEPVAARRVLLGQGLPAEAGLDRKVDGDEDWCRGGDGGVRWQEGGRPTAVSCR